MTRKVLVLDEHNDKGHLLWMPDYPGAFSRGKTTQEAAAKVSSDLTGYLAWRDGARIAVDAQVYAAFEHYTTVDTDQADTEVLLPGEGQPLSAEEYRSLKGLAIRSAVDFQSLYDSIPAKDKAVSPARKTFYGDVPLTAEEMFLHTAQANANYFRQLGINAPYSKGEEIVKSRLIGFEAIEGRPDYLRNAQLKGDFSEVWTLRKLIRRFIWHDRIHARALWRLANALYGEDAVPNLFSFAHETDRIKHTLVS